MADDNIKISQLTTAPDTSGEILFPGIKNNGDGTYTNYKYTNDQVAAIAAAGSSLLFTVTGDSVNISDAFFALPVSDIITQGQAYIVGVELTQDLTTQTLTLVNGSTFITGQIVLIKR